MEEYTYLSWNIITPLVIDIFILEQLEALGKYPKVIRMYWGGLFDHPAKYETRPLFKIGHHRGPAANIMLVSQSHSAIYVLNLPTM